MAKNSFFQIFVQYCVEHCPKAETYQIWWIYLKYGGFSILGVQKSFKKKAKSSAISSQSQNSQKINIKQHVHVITPYLGILKRILTCPSFKRWLVQSFKNNTGQAKVEKPKKCKKKNISPLCVETHACKLDQIKVSWVPTFDHSYSHMWPKTHSQYFFFTFFRIFHFHSPHHTEIENRLVWRKMFVYLSKWIGYAK